jgi:hypothetical protein
MGLPEPIESPPTPKVSVAHLPRDSRFRDHDDGPGVSGADTVTIVVSFAPRNVR